MLSRGGVAIDLGTVNTLIWVDGRGLVGDQSHVGGAALPEAGEEPAKVLAEQAPGRPWSPSARAAASTA